MARKYKSKKGGAGFHPGKKPSKKKRSNTKSDRKKMKQRLKNRRPSQKPSYNTRYRTNLSVIYSGDHSAVERQPYNITELKRKTFIIHAHGEFMIDPVSHERKLYDLPDYINIGTVVSCGITFVIPGHRGNHDSVEFIENICHNKYKFAWTHADRKIDDLIFSNYKYNHRTYANPHAPVFNAGIWMCDLRSRNSGPTKIYDLEKQNHMGVQANKNKLTLTEVVKYCQRESLEPFDLIIATCYAPTLPRNTAPNTNNLSNMLATLEFK
jgi:hypothetical protein